MKFRNLGDTETRIIMSRHEEHGTHGTLKNQLPQTAIRRARERGRVLREAGFVPGSAHSSQQPRCIHSLIETMVGMGNLLQINTLNDLGDLVADPSIARSLLDSEQARLNLATSEEACLALNVDKRIQMTMLERGMRGAVALRKIALNTPKRNALVFSHGGTRAEISILALKNRDALNRDQLGVPEQMLQMGDMVELIIDRSTGEIIEENYLEFNL